MFVESNGERFAIGTLDSKRCPQFSCDLTLGMDAVLLSHSGPSPVHLTGYSVHQMMAGNASDDDDDEYEQGGGEHYGLGGPRLSRDCCCCCCCNSVPMCRCTSATRYAVHHAPVVRCRL